jgi:chromosome segregation ATPase
MDETSVPPGFKFLANRFDKAIGELNAELRSTAEQNEKRWEQNEKRWEQAEHRFEAIETALRDMSQELVIHSRALNALLSRRPEDEEWRDGVERRLRALEQRGH